MEQYISKSALVAKIDKGINGRNDWQLDEYRKGYHDALTMLKNYLSILKVKEVDFEEYYHEFLQKEWFGNSHVRTVSEMMAFTAKHFFELGMAVSNKAQKENSI